MNIKKEAILKAAGDLTENYGREELFMPKNGRSLPNRAVIINLVRDLRSVIFPGYFGEVHNLVHKILKSFSKE